MVKYTGDSTPKFNSLPLYFFYITEFKKKFTLLKASLNSLFSIVLGCRLDDQEIFVQFPAETRVSFFLSFSFLFFGGGGGGLS